MSSNRVFSEAELKELGTRTRDLVDKAIDAGELDKAKRLNHRAYAEWLSMHDDLRDWVTSLLSYVYEHYGIDALYEALKQSCTAWFKPAYENLEKIKDFRQKVEALTMGLRGHLQPIEIEEDDDKVCLTMHPCGSGERLIRDGGYEPPLNFSKVRDPHFITFGQSDFPIYCTHTPMLEILQMEWGGDPRMVCEVPEDVKQGGCRFCIYKEPKSIPKRFYTRVGKKKEA